MSVRLWRVVFDPDWPFVIQETLKNKVVFKDKKLKPIWDCLAYLATDASYLLILQIAIFYL
jgi:hypothetical protein